MIDPMSNEDGCEGCTRRTALQIVAASTLVPIGCRMDDPSIPGETPDGAADDAVAGTGFMLSGNTLTVDLMHPLNAQLNTVNGSRRIDLTSPVRRVMIFRISTTAFNTFTAICTHAGCSVAFNATTSRFRCPCHGSQFATDGTVFTGPATANLATFSNTFDEPGAMLSITV